LPDEESNVEMSYLQIKDLVKRFGDVVAVDDFSLEIGKDEFLVLLGPSGCGKTTTLRIIAGLEIQTEGQILLDGKDISDIPPENRDMAMVFQNLALYPHMTVFDNIAFYLRNVKTPKDEIDRRVREAAEKVQISELLHRYPAQISGGQSQRVALARSLIRSPKVLLLDEPLASLDAKLRANMRSEFKLIHKQVQSEDGGPFIYVTHDQVEALTLGTKVAVMNEGRLEQIDTPDRLYNRPQNIFTAKFIGSPEMNLIEGRVVRGEQGWEFEYGTFRSAIELDEDAHPKEGKIVLGVRPEDVEILTDQGKGFPAEVLTIELMGQNYFVLMKIDSNLNVASLAKSADDIKDGAMVDISFTPGKIHLFDPETGTRV
jgi:multiple sugar transport system ATP-binding protein